jgi:hypothetical protein
MIEQLNSLRLWLGCVLALAMIVHSSSLVRSTQTVDDTQTAAVALRTEPQKTEPESDRTPKIDPKQIAEDRTSRAAARAKGELTFDDLKFEIEKGGKFKRSMLTKEIEELHKKNVRIRGYILPQSVFKTSGIEEFVLVRDNMECCFGPGAALYDCIIVHMEKGKTADFTTRPVAVKGKFEIKEFKYDPKGDEHYAIYQLTATEVK